MIPSRWLDFLFPPSCHLCQAPLRNGRYLCSPCRETLPRVTSPLCTRCGLSFDGTQPDPASCPNCRDRSYAFDFARSALLARDGARELVHAFKYERRLHLHHELATLTAEALDDERLSATPPTEWTLVPVPLHWRRQQWRWFNQAHEIARELAKLRNLPLHRALRRTRFTTQQTLLTRGQRLQNLQGAFRLSRCEQRRQLLRGKAVLLIDDVFTTGSTANECARVLKEDGGVEKVVVLTALRG
ncbi:MAG: ComF family protein [Verrucomicrobia bacterium]|nr:ComF family protein [Verrucomicrobiota bacterium]MDA1007002.1 ComF family protein [Verrucomicrobiota bacterium]